MKFKMNKVKEVQLALGLKTYSELAELMKLNPGTLKQWASTGKYPERFIASSETLIRNQQLERAAYKIHSGLHELANLFEEG